ncbi:MAG: SpoIID/LytB domain-containing protein [Mobilitalea sp.]
MSTKRKLILIGICVAIIIVVFTVNVYRRINDDKQGNLEDAITKENIISRAEAYRLLSYLDYDKTERESLPIGITYAKEQMSDWYDTYVNAVWKMGLIEGSVTIAPKEALTYGACKSLIDQLIIKNPNFQSVYTDLSFDFMKAEEEMLISEFLEMYEAILAIIPEEEQLLTQETLLVLGREVTEDGKDRMVTDQGKYYYQNAKGYEIQFEQMQQALQPDDGAVTEGEIVEKGESGNSLSEDKATQDKATQDISTVEGDQKSLVDQYMDKAVKVLVSNQELIYITSVTMDKIVIPNVWIENGENLQVDTFVNGIHKSFSAEFKLSNPIKKVIGDITVENQKVVRISVKPDMIQGKVLRSGKDFIEIEGYGKVPLEKDYKIYKIYGEMSIEPTGSILVGYENTDFIVSGGKISAALITESIKAENIRVLIQTTGFKDILHEKVEFTATTDFTVSSKEKDYTYLAGETVTIKQGDELLEDGRITIKPLSDNGKIEIQSIDRTNSSPKYRGIIEIAEGESGLLIVNELPLEEYLYAVIPSEMPTSYGNEALKVQAVCARSYAYKHLLANSLSQYGAHVDDSVSYQVYNNIAENEDSILAVKDTYGQVIEYEGDVITAYYFSTSCGHTTEAASVWANDIKMPYLSGKLILIEEEGEQTEAQNELADQYQDLSSEENFRSFIEAKEVPTYDSTFNWYRWKVTMGIKEIKKVIDNNLAKRYNANPELIMTMTSKAENGEEAVYESIPVDTVGTIVDISVIKREASGIISELLITGSKNTIKVRTEYNIRTLLAPAYDTIIRQDDSAVEKLSLLPSAFFVFDKKEKSGKLSSITLTGGGYGHGVGMSQNGVKALADSGKEYEEIVSYFYEGTEMGFIYE